MQVLNNETLFSAYNIYCYFLHNVFYHIMFHSEPQSCIYPCKTTHGDKTDGQQHQSCRETEHAQFTVQDYPARLHASHCATLQRVG